MKKSGRPRGKRVYFGSGSTRRVSLHYDARKITPSFFDELIGGCEAPTFLRETEGLAKACGEILKREGIDPDNPGVLPARYGKQDNLYYAYNVLTYWQQVVCGIERGEADYAARYALSLGKTLREWQMKRFADRGLEAYQIAGRKEPRVGKKRGRPGKTSGSEEIAARNKRITALFMAERRKNPKSKQSDTALMAKIGRSQNPPLGRTQAIRIISQQIKDSKD